VDDFIESIRSSAPCLISLSDSDPGVFRLYGGNFNSKISIEKTFTSGLERNCYYLLEDEGLSLLGRIEDATLTLIITSECNENCFICPQRLGRDPKSHGTALLRLLSIIDLSCVSSVYFTGGEPLLKPNLITDLLHCIPESIEVYILTNAFAIPNDASFATRDRLTFCVPLYGSTKMLHDGIVNRKGFYRTVKNLYSLAENGGRIELRNVLTQQNHTNLLNYSHFVFNNFPFVANVAFMGMELTEKAFENRQKYWIDPRSYIPMLQSSMDILLDFDMPFSVYNLQPCLFEEKYTKYLTASISPWKRQYLPTCVSCEKRLSCGGMFESVLPMYMDMLL
jgi:His-Xaa-Ser system radical SAM maturase HxsC